MEVLYAVVLASGLYTNGVVSNTLPITDNPFKPWMEKCECESLAASIKGARCVEIGRMVRR